MLPVAQRAPAIAWSVCLVGVLALTNSWPDYARGLEILGQTDTASYRAIALAAPGVPTEPVDYQHAQRFWLPWAIGLAARSSGLSLILLHRCTAILLLLALVVVFVRILRALPLAVAWHPVLAAAAAFHPYSARYYLSVPFMAPQLLFSVGFAIVTLGFVRASLKTTALGLVLAALGRQTAMPLMLIVWIYAATRWARRETNAGDLVSLGVASLATVSIYWLGGVFAAATGAVSDNLGHLTGLYVWLMSEEPHRISGLGAFLLRGAFSQGPALALLLAVIPAARPIRKPVTPWLLLLVLAVWAQPVLGGPEITSNNIMRLWSFAYVGVLALSAVIVSDANLELPAPVARAAVGVILAGSMHHQWSWPGEMLLRTPVRFGVVFAATSVLLGVLIHRGIRSRSSIGSIDTIK